MYRFLINGKSMDWFLYDKGLRLERVNLLKSKLTRFCFGESFNCYFEI